MYSGKVTTRQTASMENEPFMHDCGNNTPFAYKPIFILIPFEMHNNGKCAPFSAACGLCCLFKRKAL